MSKRYGPKSLAFFAATKVMMPMDDDRPSYSIPRRASASVFVIGMLNIISFGTVILMLVGTVGSIPLYQITLHNFLHLPWWASIPLGLALTVVTGGGLYWLVDKTMEAAFDYEHER